jgi:hypothetical protein
MDQGCLVAKIYRAFICGGFGWGQCIGLISLADDLLADNLEAKLTVWTNPH